MNEWRNTLRPQVEARHYVPANRDSLEKFRERMKARAREVGARIPGDANPIRKPVWD